jgi:hypothetical protein
MRQYVAITGLDMDSFDITLDGFAKVYCFFRNTLPHDRMEDFHPVSMGGYTALACHTRYFTLRRNCYSAVQKPFGPGVDPNGDLEHLKGDAHVHTEDNIVQYLGVKQTDDGSLYVIY